MKKRHGFFVYTLKGNIYILWNILYKDGYRLSGIEAVKADFTVGEDIQLFGEVKKDWGTVYLLKTPNAIKTALMFKSGLLWKCGSTTFLNVNKDDAVKTVGWQSYSDDKGRQITLIAVDTTDPNVKFIEAGNGVQRLKKEITVGNTVVFSWDKVVPFNEINAIALNNDNMKLYEYGFPKNTNVINTKDLKWYQYKN